MHIPNDKQLLSAIQKGNQQAFRQVFDIYWKKLYSIIQSIIRDEETTKDILQNTFIAFWERRCSFVVEQSLFPILVKIAKNDVIDLFRKNKVRLAWADELTAELHTSYAADAEYIAKELGTEIDAAIVSMPVNMKHCYQLSRHHDKSIKEIAAELRLSEQTVKNNISEALKRLRHHIKLIES